MSRLTPGGHRTGPGADPGDDFDWFERTAPPGGAPPRSRGPATGAPSHPETDPGDRSSTAQVLAAWREQAADRVPLALRGAARGPVAAVVATLLVVLAVVAGAVLRSSSAGAEVVDLGRVPAAASTAGASAPAGVGTGAVGAGPTLPGGTPAGSVPVALPAGPGTPGGGSAAAAVVVVDVVGRVRRPGLVRLPAGSRVADAVAAAGGPTDAAVLARINLARPLADGEQVLVPDRDDVVPPAALPAAPAGGAGSGAGSGAGGGAGSGAPAGPLDLNAATAADLDGLPGIGPVIAGRIVAWRTEHGRFGTVDELAEVAGIGPTLLERLRPLVRV